MDISVVIPTCNRKKRLLSLLQNLDNSLLPVKEVIIVDSGVEQLTEADLVAFSNLSIRYILSERSVCIQRNKGIAAATSDWIFLCDDDIEVPEDYLSNLADHIKQHPDAGAVSGLCMQQDKGIWVGSYPLVSVRQLLWCYIFQFPMWGEIKCNSENILIKKIKQFYANKGNHIAKAGWPVLTHFTGKYTTTPLYGLGASLIKKEWLNNSPYDEVLDPHGIGDHYGVAAGFPGHIHVVTETCVYHHQEKSNRLDPPLQYYRRVLALDYFRNKSKKLKHVKKGWLIWSLSGNFIQSVFSLNRRMINATFKPLYIVGFGMNPYKKAARKNLKITEPQL